MTHPALTSDSTAVITGGAAGIGLAVARRLAAMGLSVAIGDREAGRLSAAEAELIDSGAAGVLTFELDVSDMAQVHAFRAAVDARFGGTDILMNNAGVQPATSISGPREAWEAILGINLWGVVNGIQAFVPGMIERGRPGLVINTGSKQGITTPPGNPSYNVSKAGVKALTEALAHELRNTDGARLSAHLLIPGFVFTELTRNGRTEKPASAWTPDQTAKFLFERLEAGDFYILCPDNDVPRALDEKRMAWAMGDIIENRPALSRWHPEWTDRFESFVAAD